MISEPDLFILLMRVFERSKTLLVGDVMLDASKAIAKELATAMPPAQPMSRPEADFAELLAMARLVKRTLLKQQAYFKAANPAEKRERLIESKDLERRLFKAADEVLERASHVPSLFEQAEGGGRAAHPKA